MGLFSPKAASIVFDEPLSMNQDLRLLQLLLYQIADGLDAASSEKLEQPKRFDFANLYIPIRARPGVTGNSLIRDLGEICSDGLPGSASLQLRLNLRVDGAPRCEPCCVVCKIPSVSGPMKLSRSEYCRVQKNNAGAFARCKADSIGAPLALYAGLKSVRTGSVGEIESHYQDDSLSGVQVFVRPRAGNLAVSPSSPPREGQAPI